MQSIQPTPAAWTREPRWQLSPSHRPPPPAFGPHAEPHTVPQPGANSSTGAGLSERSSAPKRRACNECRQQKLRCELANLDDPSVTVCSRCVKLGLRCQIDESFQRTRKRKRSVDFENEISTLRKQLAQYEKPVLEARLSCSASTQYDLPQYGTNADTMLVNGASSGRGELLISETATRPHEHEVQAQADPVIRSGIATPQPRSLGDVEVSVEEADKLFSSYFTNYHGFLPVLDSTRSSQAFYETSPLLFWCIIAVAARRHQSNRMLHSQLADTVSDLLWTAIRSVPHSLGLVQSLLLLCTWPFPTSSSQKDATYILAGVLIHSSLQMGLNRPTHQQDFTKYRVKLSQQEVANRITIWTACNIVVHCVSIGVGLQTPAQLHDWASVFGSSPSMSHALPLRLRHMLQVEAFRNKVTRAFAMTSSVEIMSRPINERMPMYGLLESDMAILEATLGLTDDIIKFQIHAARLHFHAFFLFDEADSLGYQERILSLFLTSCKLIEEALSMDSSHQNFLQHCPFYSYESFLCASFILLKILKSDHFSGIVDTAGGKKIFTSSISAIRLMSVSNNDLPARLSDVLAYLWNHPDPQLVSGPGLDGLRLTIQSRMSMSIVYDSLWIWRNQFPINSVGTITLSDNQQHDISQATTPGIVSFDDFDALPFDDLFFEPFFR